LLFSNFQGERANVDINIIKDLLNQPGIDVNHKGRFGDTILHHMCQNIDFISKEILQYFIESKHPDINTQDSSLNTPIHRAILNCSTQNGRDLIQYLLTLNGVDVHIRNRLDRNLLHTACSQIKSMSVPILELLLSKGNRSDLHQYDFYGETPLHLAFLGIEEDMDVNSIVYLFKQRDVNININQPGGENLTLFSIACMHTHLLPFEIFQIFIEQGADLYIRDDCELPALNYLYYESNSKNDFVKNSKYILHQYGIDIDSDDSSDIVTVLTKREYPPGLTEYLIENDMIKNPSQAKQYLMWLCSYHQDSIEEFCQANSIDFLSPSHLNFTPLHILVRKRKFYEIPKEKVPFEGEEKEEEEDYGDNEDDYAVDEDELANTLEFVIKKSFE